MMTRLDTLLLRVLLSLVLLSASMIRYNGFSFIYLIFLLISPLLPLPRSRRDKTIVQIFLILLITLSCIFTLSHPTLHIILAVAPPYDDALKTCEDVTIAAQIGVQRLNGMLFYRALRLVLPDMVILATAVGLLVYISRRGNRAFLRNLSSSVKPLDQDGQATNRPSGTEASQNTQSTNFLPRPINLNLAPLRFVRVWDWDQKQFWRAWALDAICMITIVILTCITGITSPSVLSCVYLLSFLSICTYWACQPTKTPLIFTYLRLFLLIYSGLHVCLYYLYQFPFFQNICKNGGFSARLLGLYYIMQTSCDKPGQIMFPSDMRIVDYVAPPLTLLLYYSLVIETRRWIDLENERTAAHRISNHPVNIDDNWNSLDPIEAPASPSEYIPSGPGITEAPPAIDETRSTTNKMSTMSLFDETGPAGRSVFHLDENDDGNEQQELATSSVNTHNPDPGVSRTTEANRIADTSRRIGQAGQQSFTMANNNHMTVTNNNVRQERPLLLSLYVSAIKNSYILTLIAMMAWAVTYRSWLSFILLLSACILWIAPNSRVACLYSSPLIVLYSTVLILIQYVYGMNLNDDELPKEVTPDGLKLSELGMRKWRNSVGVLSMQVAFHICFWLTLRLFVNERSAQSLTTGALARATLPSWRNHGPTPILNPLSAVGSAWFGLNYPFGNVDGAVYRKFTGFLHAICIKYWIVVCCLSMLLISVQTPVVIFRIVYMVMLIYFMLTFQISFRFWRRQMIFFWWINVVYSMMVLLCIYTYQFQGSPEFWKRTTGLSEAILKDIGLETFASGALFQRLLTPVLFLVVIILQVHYFHEPFLKRSALNRAHHPTALDHITSVLPTTSADKLTGASVSTSSGLSNFMEDVNSALHTVVAKLTAWATSLNNSFWRFLEIHWIKLVALLIILHAVKEVTVPNLVSVILMVVCFPFPSLHGFGATILFLWNGLITLCKMSFQLNVFTINATLTCGPPLNTTTELTNSTWLGLIKVDDFEEYNRPLGAIMAVCVCWHAIAYRQRQFYNNPHNEKPRWGIVFPRVTIASLDSGLWNLVMFVFNYGFYKLGLEICFCITVITSCLRADAFSVLYLTVLILFLFMPRELCAKLWLPYLIFLAVLIPVQYAGCVGLPPGLCWTFPWITAGVQSNFLRWLFLPGAYGYPTAEKLIADFFQFAAVALQYQVFRIEQSSEGNVYGGGSNKPVLDDQPPRKDERDFVGCKQSYLDYLRHLIFYWSYWVSLAVVFATGITWITLFCMGYMIISFIYLWMGQNVMLLKRVNLIRSWNVIIGYNFFVILSKCSLQLLGCISWPGLPDLCSLIQLFGIRCMDPMSWSRFDLPKYPSECTPDSSGLHWDVACFAFIILQRKIFMTRSFSHVVLDLTVQSQFVSRGACLINRKLMSTIHEQAAREAYLIYRVREKLELIKRRQAALGRNTANITEHYIMLRSGDYDLFEGDPEQEDELDPTTDQGSKQQKKRPPSSGRSLSPSSKAARLKRPGKKSASQPTSPRRQPTQDRSYSIQHPAPTLQIDPRTRQVRLKNQAVVDTLPNLDPSVLRVLATYTDPYNVSRMDETSSNNIIPGTLENLIATSYKDGRLYGHRRMRSHPEYPRRPLLTSQGSTEIVSSAACDQFLPAVRTPMWTIQQASLEPTRRIQRPSGDMRRKPYQTHRRILSASAAPSDSLPTGPIPVTSLRPARAIKKPAVVVSPTVDQPFTTISELQFHDLAGRKYSVPAQSVSFAKATVHAPAQRDSAPDLVAYAKQQSSRSDGSNRHGSRPLYSDDDEDGFGEWASLDADEDEDYDDANPPPSLAPRLNPFQLLNRAMACGPYSAVRQYRRSLLFSPRDEEEKQEEEEEGEAAAGDRPVETAVSTEPPHPLASTSHGAPPSDFLHPPLEQPYPRQFLPQNKTRRTHLPVTADHRSTNQSNRIKFVGRRGKRFKLPSLASTSGEDELSESLLQPEADMTYDLDPYLTTGLDLESDTRNVVYSRRTSERQPVVEQSGRFDEAKELTSSEPLLPHKSRDTTDSLSEEENLKEPASKPSMSAARSQEGCWSNFKAFCVLCYMFLISTIDSLIRFLNRLTKQYRRIRRTIEDEKSMFKKKVIDFSERYGASGLDIETAVSRVADRSPDHRPMSAQPQRFDDLYTGPESFNDMQLEAPDYTDRQEHDLREKAFRRSRSRGFLFLIALGNLGIVYSEWFCYLLLVINHMRTSALLSLAYPLAVFLWGMLSVPRPTKTFWIFLITYTEVVTVIKYIFQFKFIHFNDPLEKPSDSAEALWLPRLLGIDKHASYALIDLIQLIVLFLHRGFLKTDGLWRDHTEAVQDLQLVAQTSKSRSLSEPVDHKYEVKPRDSRHRDNTQASVSTGSQTPAPLIRSRQTSSMWNPFAKFRRFYDKMTDPRYNKKVDVYIYMFLCEFISFWIMIFGYVSFGPSTGMGDNAFEFIKSNRIPLPFISMLLVQFVFIIIDRGLFLRKQVLGKFIFQIFHVLIIHIWLFFILPYITKVRFTAGIAPQLLYLIKCIYFSLSAYQIRSGYPFRILGNFLTKNYNYVNLILFKGYMLVPFLYELRNVMDWMWTNSALSLYHWMELEDIYCKIFVLKCWRRSEIAYPTPRGVNRPKGKKALVGGLLLAFFFLCFWGPMILSSFLGATFNFNPPVLCSFSLSFGGFPAIFEFDSREGNILPISQQLLMDFARCHEKDQHTVGFLHNFESNDLRYITIDGFSGNLWAITPPSLDTLLTKLGDRNGVLLLHFFMQCRRQTKEIQTSHISVENIFSRPLVWEEKQDLLSILNETHPNKSATLNAVMPRYVLLRKDRLRDAYARLGERITYVNVSFSIQRGATEPQSWWELREREPEPSADPCFERLRGPVIGPAAAKVLSLVTFNERVSDSLFGKVFTNYGIIGMYAAYIFLANRLLRTIYSNISYVIHLEELPHVDRILKLCNEIYLVRENKLLLLEEQLVAKLFFLYRSSETMIKWTRHPKHIIEKFTNPAGPQPEASASSLNTPEPLPSNDPSEVGSNGRNNGRPLDQNESNAVLLTRRSHNPSRPAAASRSNR